MPRYFKWVLLAGGVVLGLTGLVWWLGQGPVPAPNRQTKAPVNKRYVALGDSVAAGLGLPAVSPADGCGRSIQAYPDLVADALDRRVTSLACSGATVQAGLLGSQPVADQARPAQAASLFAGPPPSLITITAGANDVGWSDNLSRCYLLDCGSAADEARTGERLNRLDQELTGLLDSITDRYKTQPPRVIITGYYRLFPVDPPAGCREASVMEPGEREWWARQGQALNDRIKAVADRYESVRYAEADFRGHEVCTAEPWVQGLGDPAPAHPTAAGHQALARAIVSVSDMN